MPLTEVALTFVLAVVGMIICSGIMYTSIGRMTAPLLAFVVAGLIIPVIMNILWTMLLPFVTIMDYPKTSFIVPTGPGVAIAVGCWAGLFIGYYAGLQLDEYGDTSCYRCSLKIFAVMLIGMLAFIMIP